MKMIECHSKLRRVERHKIDHYQPHACLAAREMHRPNVEFDWPSILAPMPQFLQDRQQERERGKPD